MKILFNNLFICAGFSLLTLAACNSSDYKKESTSTEINTSEPANTMMTDTTQQMMMADTSNQMRTDTAGSMNMNKPSASVKSKKGKISTTMMTANAKTPMNQDKQGYYSNVEVLPMFPGGQNALNGYFTDNLEYPADATDNGIEGVVTVNFAVDEAGKVSNARILGKPLGYGLEEEVVRAVNKMPAWTPGAIKGKNVKTYYTLPVNFRLQ